MNPTIATAAIGLVPVVQGVKGNIASQLAGSGVMRDADNAGRSIGSRIGSSITSGVKSAVKIGGVITGALAGITLKGGFDRALGIEDAQALMKGLGHDTKSVDMIMQNALASVEGTAFGLDAAATTAASAVAAGIEPGSQLEQVLSTVANTAAAAKAPMDEMGAIFTSVAAVGTAYTGDIQMIAQRGIPIWQSLSDVLGVSVEEVKKMASEGKIDFATFEQAARDAAGGVATAMGDTTRGAFANMMAAVRNLGATFATGILPLAKTTFLGIQGLVKAVNAKIKPFVEGFFQSFGGSAQAGIEGFFNNLIAKVEAFDPAPVVAFFKEIQGGFRAFGAAWGAFDGEVTSAGFPGFMEQAAYWIRYFWESVKTLDLTAISNGFSGVASAISGMSSGGTGGGIGGSLAAIGQAAPELLAAGLEILAGAMSLLADHSDTIVKLFPLLLAGFVAWRGATAGMAAANMANTAAYHALLPVMLANNIARIAATSSEHAFLRAKLASNRAEVQSVATKGASTAATIRATVAERARTVATKAAAIAQRAFGAAMRFAMGPIGWIIAGVAVLGTALWAFFTKTEIGQQLWSRIWGAIQGAAAGVVGWFTGTLLPSLQSVWNILTKGDYTGGLGGEDSGIVNVLFTIREAAMSVIGWFTGTLIPSIKSVWSILTKGDYTGGLGGEDSGIVSVLLAIRHGGEAVFAWITGTLIPGIKAAFTAIGNAAVWLWQNAIQPAWHGIRVGIAVVIAVVMTLVQGLVWYWTNILGPAAMWLWQSVLAPAWNGIKAAISAVVSWITQTAWPAIQTAWSAIGTATMWLWQNVLQPAWNGIKAAISAVVGWLRDVAWPIINTVIAVISHRFKLLQRDLMIVWAYIRHYVINPVVSWFQNTVKPIFDTVIAVISHRFKLLQRDLMIVWAYIRHYVINPVVSWFQNTVKPIFDRTIQGITDAFGKLKDSIKKAWNGIRDAAKAPIRFVVETVLNGALIRNFNKVAGKLGIKKLDTVSLPSGFARGGILPGMSRMRDGDDQLVPMRRGEGVLVSEGLRRARDKAAFLAVNAAARRGVGFADMLGGGFARGGIFDRLKGAGSKAKDLAGHALDKLLDGVGFVAEAISDPAGMFKKLLESVNASIPAAGVFTDAAKAVGRKVVDGIAQKITGGLGPDAAAPPTVGSALKAGGSLALAQRVARGFGLTMTSFRRGGARTAGSGSVSLHALGRAMDFSNSSGPTPQMMGFFNAMHPYRPTELLYSPAGRRQWRRGGRMADTSGATKRGHYNHVHIGFAKGGIVPTLFDQGGRLDPGVHVVANKHRRPETVLPPDESKWLKKSAQDGAGGTQFIYQPTQVDLDEQVEHRMHREFETMMHAARKVVSV